ncbi:MAG: vitamin B12 dependent-methionine synthase activation domain-containing protein, partial [Bacteroidota bacterium]
SGIMRGREFYWKALYSFSRDEAEHNDLRESVDEMQKKFDEANAEHTEKYKLFKLLNATETVQISLTESLAMYPASSVCGWYISHPQSHYFGIGKIGEDQLADYAQRKGISRDEAEKWLRQNME